MDDDPQFCLRWNKHQNNLIRAFDTLLENGTLVDCTLAADGKFLKAHKVVLCACSPYFASLLSEHYDKHPILILKDVKFQELQAMMDYMYRGEVNISRNQLAAFLKAAESLQIKGLSENRSGSLVKDGNNIQQKQQLIVSGGADSSAATEQNNKRTNAELAEGSTNPLSHKRVCRSQIATDTSTKKTNDGKNLNDGNNDEKEQTTVRHENETNTNGSNQDKIDSELLVAIKKEYENGNDETVENQAMADDEQTGPTVIFSSESGEDSARSQNQSLEEVCIASQEEEGQHRDAQSTKRRTSVNAAVVSKTKPAIAQNNTSSIPSQPTAELPKSAASVSAQKDPVADVAPVAKNDAENIKPKSDGLSDITQNSLTAIMNEKSAVLTTNPTRLTRQYRQRIRIKYSSEHCTRVKLLNERSTTEENIQKTVQSSATNNDTLPMDTKLAENLVNLNKDETKCSGSGQSTASVKASAAAANKAKKKAHKIATASNVKMERTYKIDGKSGDKLFPCRHCGRKYRWKSTLRRHENDECGNKEPAYQCPYCEYKAKQRGNLGVHVRKHHSDKPKLESSRNRKTI